MTDEIARHIREVGPCGNYHGGLSIKDDGEKFYWSIEDWDGYQWEEIPESLYRALEAHQNETEK